jgi:hypothetical protein
MKHLFATHNTQSDVVLRLNFLLPAASLSGMLKSRAFLWTLFLRLDLLVRT